MTHSRAFLLLIYLLLTANYCLCKDRHNIRMALEPFQLNQIRLLPSPFKHAQTLDAEWLLSLEPDRLLHRFHKNAGLPPKADNYGGWEHWKRKKASKSNLKIKNFEDFYYAVMGNRKRRWQGLGTLYVRMCHDVGFDGRTEV